MTVYQSALARRAPEMDPLHMEHHMTALDFRRWLDAMKDAGMARSDRDCMRALGVTKNTIMSYKSRGTDTSTALACRALLHRLAPWGAGA